MYFMSAYYMLFYRFIFTIFIIRMCMSVCEYVHMSLSNHRINKCYISQHVYLESTLKCYVKQYVLLTTEKSL